MRTSCKSHGVWDGVILNGWIQNRPRYRRGGAGFVSYFMLQARVMPSEYNEISAKYLSPVSSIIMYPFLTFTKKP